MIRSQNTRVNNPPEKLASYIVPAEFRMQFLPSHFGVLCVDFEAAVYGWLDYWSADYNGGYWDFFRLSNGGLYIAPSGDRRFKIENPGNYFEGVLSSDAAGIAASLMAMSHLSFDHPRAMFADRFHRLRQYALDHKECTTIMRLID